MFRYLAEAFWARPALPGVGRVPWNVVALAGFAILGFGHEGFWLLGAGFEAAYLAVLLSSPRFREWVDANSRATEQEAERTSREGALASLGPAALTRHRRLEEQIARTIRSYEKSDIGELLAENNRAALTQLADVHLRLLAAQQGLEDLFAATDVTQLQREIDAVRTGLAAERLSASLRTSKAATLEILERRLANVSRREESLAEIEGDLTRIEAQVTLARENAAMTSHPAAVSANIQLASHLLDDPTWSGPPSVTQ